MTRCAWIEPSVPRRGVVLTASEIVRRPADILLVDKPRGITSHDVVSRARRALGTRKVGHAGTLDPMATGLLMLGVDSSTRLLTYLVGLGKEYTATIRLGVGDRHRRRRGRDLATRGCRGARRVDRDRRRRSRR